MGIYTPIWERIAKWFLRRWCKHPEMYVQGGYNAEYEVYCPRCRFNSEAVGQPLSQHLKVWGPRRPEPGAQAKGGE